MSNQATTGEPEDDCLCQAFVPEGQRVDFQHIVTDPKTGGRKWKTYLRYHQQCPEHGIERNKD